MAKNNNTKNGKKVPVTFLEEDEGKQEETKETKSKSWISVLNCEGCKSISECHKALLQGKVIDATVKCYKDWTDEEKDALPKTIKSALD